MAKNGAGDVNGGGNRSAHYDYYKTFIGSVLDAVEKRRREVPADSRDPFTGSTPCAAEEDRGSNGVAELENQMDHCMCLAFETLDFALGKVEGEDINYFVRSQIKYFHVVFSGVKQGERRRRFYFAELNGKEEPETVTTCVELCKGEYTTENCEYCGGIWHPCAGGFTGFLEDY